MQHRATRIAVVGALALALFVAAGLGPFRRVDRAAPPAGAPGSETLLQPVLSGSLDRIISSLQQRLRVLPDDYRSFASLGLAYVQQARLTADPSYYPKAEGVLQRSLALDAKDNYAAMVGMAALAAARHDFAAALDWGERAKTINSANGNVYGVIGDAQVELGRYAHAYASFQKMVDTLPGLSSYARVSYARELQGNVPGAIASMQAAFDVTGSPADQAWASNQLGDLEFNHGAIASAEADYRRAAGLDPAFVPARAGLAKVAWARGDLDAARRLMTAVVATYPLPDYVIMLGDLDARSGDRVGATRQYALVRAEARLFSANGVNVDLELAIFDADHGDPQAAVRAARTEWQRRKSVLVADALAWALHVDGRDHAAWTLERRAMSIGYRNALFFFHAGQIRLSMGDRAAGASYLRRALATNPHFSVRWAPVAERELARIGAHR
jgi:predicted negative regulator of RcsB-dependent stress response